MILNQAKINGLDLFSAYSVGIVSGLKDMTMPADLKIVEAYDYPEVNGKEYSLISAIQDVDISLSCFMIGSSMSDLIAKKNDFCTMLQSPDYKELTVTDTGVVYTVKYNKISSWAVDIARDNSRIAKFNLELTIIMGNTNQIITIIMDGNGDN